MDNRYPFTGVVVEIGDTKRISSYFTKREFKLRYTDIDFKNNIVERIAKFAFQNDDCILGDDIRVEDLVKVTFMVDGRDLVKNDVKMNFTSLVAIEVSILSSPSRDTQKEREMPITSEGRDIRKEIQEATDEELAGKFDDDPLIQTWNQMQDKKKIEFDEPPF